MCLLYELLFYRVIRSGRVAGGRGRGRGKHKAENYGRTIKGGGKGADNEAEAEAKPLARAERINETSRYKLGLTPGGKGGSCFPP